MAEGYAVLLHDPVDGATADAAAEAVPEVLGRGHYQAGGGVFVEGAAAQAILAGGLEFDAGGFDQAFDGYFFL